MTYAVKNVPVLGIEFPRSEIVELKLPNSETESVSSRCNILCHKKKENKLHTQTHICMHI